MMIWASCPNAFPGRDHPKRLLQALGPPLDDEPRGVHLNGKWIQGRGEDGAYPFFVYRQTFSPAGGDTLLIGGFVDLVEAKLYSFL